MAAGLTKGKGRRNVKYRAMYDLLTKRNSWKTQKEKRAKVHQRRMQARLLKIQRRMERLGKKFVERGTARRLRREAQGLHSLWLKNQGVPELGV